MPKTIALICGTRPEIIKMAPVYHAIAATPGLKPFLVHSGQHTDLAQPVYELFGMRPDCNIELSREKPDLAHLSAILLESLFDALNQAKPVAVLVHGDTTTAAMGALASFYLQIPVGHVEAGLRTGERYSPFPEEMNRTIIGRIAHWHFSPTERSRSALLAEGIPEPTIEVTGNTVIDAALLMSGRISADTAHRTQVQAWVDSQVARHRRLVLVTAHRRENWGQGLREIAQSVVHILQDNPDCCVLWPMHANPAVKEVILQEIEHIQGISERLLLTQPIDYPDLIWALSNSWAVLTDSGGIQEEAVAFKSPVLVLRDSTERPELIEAGGGRLVGANRQRIVETFTELTQNPQMHAAMRACANPFGDGQAAQRIRDALLLTLDRPEPVIETQ